MYVNQRMPIGAFERTRSHAERKHSKSHARRAHTWHASNSQHARTLQIQSPACPRSGACLGPYHWITRKRVTIRGHMGTHPDRLDMMTCSVCARTEIDFGGPYIFTNLDWWINNPYIPSCSRCSQLECRRVLRRIVAIPLVRQRILDMIGDPVVVHHCELLRMFFNGRIFTRNPLYDTSTAMNRQISEGHRMWRGRLIRTCRRFAQHEDFYTLLFQFIYPCVDTL